MLQKIKDKVKNNKRFLAIYAGVTTALMPVFAFASGTGTTTSGIDWNAQFAEVQTQAMEGITAMLPLGISILGIMTAVSLGVKLYHKLSGTRS